MSGRAWWPNIPQYYYLPVWHACTCKVVATIVRVCMSHVLQVNDVTPATARMSTRKVVFIVCFIVASVAIIETAGEKSPQVCIH